MKKRQGICVLAFCASLTVPLSMAQDSGSVAQQSISIPPDSPRWEFEGAAKLAEYQGRKCILLDGGAATVKDLQLRDGVIDVDVATPALRGFFGIQFRIDGMNGEWI